MTQPTSQEASWFAEDAQATSPEALLSEAGERDPPSSGPIPEKKSATWLPIVPGLLGVLCILTAVLLLFMTSPPPASSQASSAPWLQAWHQWWQDPQSMPPTRPADQPRLPSLPTVWQERRTAALQLRSTWLPYATESEQVWEQIRTQGVPSDPWVWEARRLLDRMARWETDALAVAEGRIASPLTFTAVTEHVRGFVTASQGRPQGSAHALWRVVARAAQAMRTEWEILDTPLQPLPSVWYAQVLDAWEGSSQTTSPSWLVLFLLLLGSLGVGVQTMVGLKRTASPSLTSPQAPLEHLHVQRVLGHWSAGDWRTVHLQDTTTGPLFDALQRVHLPVTRTVIHVRNELEKARDVLEKVQEDQQKSLQPWSGWLELAKTLNEDIQTGAALRTQLPHALHTIQVGVEKAVVQMEASQQSHKEINGHVQHVRTAASEAGGRIAKVRSMLSELVGHSQHVRDFAERTKVLSVQAALVAAKSGESGQGFTLVAKGFDDLSQQAGTVSGRLASLVEGVKNEMETLDGTMHGVVRNAEEGARVAVVFTEILGRLEDAIQDTQEAVVPVSERFGVRDAYLARLENELASLAEKEPAYRTHLERASGGLLDIQQSLHAVGAHLVAWRMGEK